MDVLTVSDSESFALSVFLRLRLDLADVVVDDKVDDEGVAIVSVRESDGG